MATVNRLLILNPIEPAPFSFSTPSGLQTSVKVNIRDVNGAVMRQDLGLQMQLTGRSNGRVTAYVMPATDIVNGKAMASIPAKDLTDPNGYNLHLYGTWRGGAELLGRGELRLTGGPGISQAPEDIIDNIPLNLNYGQPAAFTVTVWQDAGKTIPFDVTTATISASIYPGQADPTILVPFTLAVTGVPGQVYLSLTIAQVNTLPTPCWWALRASSGGGVLTLAQGTVTLI